MAACPSSAVDISTKPNPRDWPVNLSETIRADSTVPCSAKRVVSCDSVAAYGNPPTYNFKLMSISPSKMILTETREMVRERKERAEDATGEAA
jgi:hypothetical protein